MYEGLKLKGQAGYKARYARQTYSSEQLGVSCTSGARHGVVRNGPTKVGMVVTASKITSRDNAGIRERAPLPECVESVCFEGSRSRR